MLSAQQSNIRMTAQLIQKRAFEAFAINSPLFEKLNDGNRLDEQELTYLLQNKMQDKVQNPFILTFLLGEAGTKYLSKIKECISLFAAIRGHNGAEYYCLFGVYALLNGVDLETAERLKLSSRLERFVQNQADHIYSMYYVCILFLYAFFAALLRLVYRIHSHYEHADSAQKAKLFRLYGSQDRLLMIELYAEDAAIAAIIDYKLESKEIISFFTAFRAKKRNILTATDVFPVQNPKFAVQGYEGD